MSRSIMSRSISVGLALLTVTGAAAAQQFSPKSLRPIERHWFVQPFDIVLDVNGEPYSIDVPGSSSSIWARMDDEGELESVLFDVRSSVKWGSSSIVDFHEEIDGAKVHVRFFPIHSGYTGWRTRIYAQTKIDHNDDWIFEPTVEFLGGADVPLSATTLTPVGPNLWELSGIFGPRWAPDPPLTLFDGTVGGQPFHISVREFGFSEWEDSVLVSNVPEPGTSLLLFACAITATFMTWPYLRDVRGRC